MEQLYGKHWVVRDRTGNFFAHVPKGGVTVACFNPRPRYTKRFASLAETRGVLQHYPDTIAKVAYPIFDYDPAFDVVEADNRQLADSDWRSSIVTPPLKRARLIEITDYFSSNGDFTPFWAMACLATPGEGEGEELSAALAWLNAANSWMAESEAATGFINILEGD